MSKQKQINPFIAMDLLRQANHLEEQGRSVLHMEVGQPFHGAPPGVVERAQNALLNQPLGYTNALGLDALKMKIAVHYKQSQNLEIDPGRIVITTGSSGGFVMCFSGLFHKGDKVALFEPSYPCYREMLKIFELEPVMIKAEEGPAKLPCLEQIVQTWQKTKFTALVIASPSNPTGRVMPPDDLKALCAWAEDQNVLLLSDEIYHGLTYGVPALSAAQFSQNVICLNSFSKYYCMTGWRIGWIVVPEKDLRLFESLSQHLYICPPALSQYAALNVFDHLDYLEGIRADYQKNRDQLTAGFTKIGLDHYAAPEGAFYLYVDISKYSDDSFDFCQQLLEREGVAACPGLDFDQTNGKGWVRFSYACDNILIKQALVRMENYLR